jgi:hypothetical protein
MVIAVFVILFQGVFRGFSTRFAAPEYSDGFEPVNPIRRAT